MDYLKCYCAPQRTLHRKEHTRYAAPPRHPHSRCCPRHCTALRVVGVEGLSTVAILQVCTLLKLVIANLAHIINIEFEEIARIISRSTCLCRSTADESQFIHFEIIDKSIEQANRGVSLYILVNAIREKNPLSSILTFLYAISFLFITTNIHKIIENQEDTRLINYK